MLPVGVVDLRRTGVCEALGHSTFEAQEKVSLLSFGSPNLSVFLRLGSLDYPGRTYMG